MKSTSITVFKQGAIVQELSLSLWLNRLRLKYVFPVENDVVLLVDIVNYLVYSYIRLYELL